MFAITYPLRTQLCIDGPKKKQLKGNKWGVNIRKEYLENLGKSTEKKY